MAARTRVENDPLQSIRRVVGGAFCIAWVWFVFNWMRPASTSFWSSIGDPWAFVVALVTSPFALIPANMTVRLLGGFFLASGAAVSFSMNKLDDAKVQRVIKAENRTNQAAIAAARAQNQRKDVINKLGTVQDYLHVLAEESDANRRGSIRLGIFQALRDIVAAYSYDDLKACIISDLATRESASRAIAGLEVAGLADGAEVAILKRAMSEAPIV